jgi:hypothetical protein
MSGAVTGIDFISADNATNSLANRQANPVQAGANSFEKWMKFRCDVAPTTQCTSFKVWGPGTSATGLTVMAGTTATGVTPTASASSVATTDLSTLTSSGASLAITGTLVNVGDLTNYVVLQMQTAGTIAPGAIPQQTINYQYTEN